MGKHDTSNENILFLGGTSFSAFIQLMLSVTCPRTSVQRSLHNGQVLNTSFICLLLIDQIESGFHHSLKGCVLSRLSTLSVFDFGSVTHCPVSRLLVVKTTTGVGLLLTWTFT